MSEHQSSEEGAEGLSEAERSSLFATITDTAGRSYGPDAICRAVERILADRLAAVMSQQPFRVAEANRLRAESAEAEITRLRAQRAEVEALAVNRCPGCFEPDHPCGDPVCDLRDQIRAALATPTSHAQREAEAGARVLREAADAATDSIAVREWLRARADALAAEAGGE